MYNYVFNRIKINKILSLIFNYFKFEKSNHNIILNNYYL